MPLSTVSDDASALLLEQLTAQQFGTFVEHLDLHRQIAFLDEIYATLDENTYLATLACATTQLHEEIDQIRHERYAREDQTHEKNRRTAYNLLKRVASLSARMQNHNQAIARRGGGLNHPPMNGHISQAVQRGGAVPEERGDSAYSVSRQHAARVSRYRHLSGLEKRVLYRDTDGNAPRTPVPSRSSTAVKRSPVCPPNLAIKRARREQGWRHFWITSDGSIDLYANKYGRPDNNKRQNLPLSSIPFTVTVTTTATDADDEDSMSSSDKENISKTTLDPPRKDTAQEHRLPTPQAAFLSIPDPPCPHASRELPNPTMQLVQSTQPTTARTPLAELRRDEVIESEAESCETVSGYREQRDGSSELGFLFDRYRQGLSQEPSEIPLQRLQDQLRMLHNDSVVTEVDEGYEASAESEESPKQGHDFRFHKLGSRPLPPIPSETGDNGECHSWRTGSKLPMRQKHGMVDDVDNSEAESDITVLGDFSRTPSPVTSVYSSSESSGIEGTHQPTRYPSSTDGTPTLKPPMRDSLSQLVSRLSDQGSLAALKRLHEQSMTERYDHPRYQRVFQNHEDNMLHLATKIYLPNDIHHQNPTCFDRLSLHGDDTFIDYDSFCDSLMHSSPRSEHTPSSMTPRVCLRGGSISSDLERDLQRAAARLESTIHDEFEPEMFTLDVASSNTHAQDPPPATSPEAVLTEEQSRGVVAQLKAYQHQQLARNIHINDIPDHEIELVLEQASRGLASMLHPREEPAEGPVAMPQSSLPEHERLVQWPIQGGYIVYPILQPQDDIYESSTDPESDRLAFADYDFIEDVFINSKGNEYFCDIDEEYLTDRFNLTSLQTEVQHYAHALDLITDMFDLEVDDDLREAIEKAARHLYGLVHARYIVTTRGLQKMSDKFKAGDFGKCPRVACDGTHLLPTGQNDTANVSPVKLYCAKCEDLYNPKSSRHATVDGAYFGTTFHNIFFQVYPSLMPAKSAQRYEPRVFGFKMHGAAALSRWQEDRRQQMCERVRGQGLDTGFEAEELMAPETGDEDIVEGEDGIDDMFEVGQPANRAAAQTVWSQAAR